MSTYINQKWDYPTMESCAKKLDVLRDASIINKANIDKAFEALAVGAQAEVDKAFIAAYAEHVPSMVAFAQILTAESQLLYSNSNAMQEADAEIATQIRQMFSKNRRDKL